MRYEFRPGDSLVIVRASAPGHDAKMESRDVTGWFEATLEEGLPAGVVTGETSVSVKSFRTGTPLLAQAARRHVGARRNKDVTFEIEDVTVAEGGGKRVRVEGALTFAGTTALFAAESTVEVTSDTVVVEGETPLSQREFGLEPPTVLGITGVKDEFGVSFRLVAHPA